MDGNGNIQVPEELKAKYLFRLPQAYSFADYIWPGLLMSPQRILAIRDIKFQPTDIIIASYPKSGACRFLCRLNNLECAFDYNRFLIIELIATHFRYNMGVRGGVGDRPQRRHGGHQGETAGRASPLAGAELRLRVGSIAFPLEGGLSLFFQLLLEELQSMQRALGYGPAMEEKDGKAKQVARVWFTHLPLELLPKSALEGGCRVGRSERVDARVSCTII